MQSLHITADAGIDFNFILLLEVELLCSTCIGKKIELLSVGSYFAGFIYYNYDFYFFFVFLLIQVVDDLVVGFPVLRVSLGMMRKVFLYAVDFYNGDFLSSFGPENDVVCERVVLFILLVLVSYFFFSAREIIDLPYKKIT